MQAHSVRVTSVREGLNHGAEIKVRGIAIWLLILPLLSASHSVRERPGPWAWVTETSDPAPALGAQAGQP